MFDFYDGENKNVFMEFYKLVLVNQNIITNQIIIV